MLEKEDGRRKNDESRMKTRDGDAKGGRRRRGKKKVENERWR